MASAITLSNHAIGTPTAVSAMHSLRALGALVVEKRDRRNTTRGVSAVVAAATEGMAVPHKRKFLRST